MLLNTVFIMLFDNIENVKKIFFRYTYGKPVKGDVTLTFSPLSYWGVRKNIKKNLKVIFVYIL